MYCPERGNIMKKINISDLLLFVIITELAGALSSLLSGGNFAGYYDTLIKPPLAPPGWLFPVVWALLYATMGFSAYLINRSDSIAKRSALILYFIQLAVNVLWSPVFFGLRSFGGAVAVIMVLAVLVAAMIAVFGRTDRCAALLNIPYLVWVIFAAYLTIGTAVLNA